MNYQGRNFLDWQKNVLNDLMAVNQANEGYICNLAVQCQDKMARTKL